MKAGMPRGYALKGLDGVGADYESGVCLVGHIRGNVRHYEIPHALFIEGAYISVAVVASRRADGEKEG